MKLQEILLEKVTKPLLTSEDVDDNGHLFKKLSSVHDGHLQVNNLGLSSLKNTPRQVNGNFHASMNSLKDFEHAPKIIDGNANFSGNLIKTLVGIQKHIKTINGTLSFGHCPIEEGGIELLKIKGLKSIKSVEAFDPFLEAIKILNKYLRKKTGEVCTAEQIKQCKDELERSSEDLKRFAIL